MDDIAEREGERLLEENERLLADPAAAVPEEVDKRCLKTIREEFRKKTLHKYLKTFKSALNVVSCIAFAVFVLFAAIYILLPQVRSATLEFLIETSGVADRLNIPA